MPNIAGYAVASREMGGQKEGCRSATNLKIRGFNRSSKALGIKLGVKSNGSEPSLILSC